MSTASPDLIDIKPKIRLTQTIEVANTSNDYFSVFGYEISKLYVFLLLSVVLLLFIWLIWKWYFDHEDDNISMLESVNDESVNTHENEESIEKVKDDVNFEEQMKNVNKE